MMESLAEGPLPEAEEAQHLYQRLQDRVHDASDRLHDRSDTAVSVIKHQRPPDGKSDWSDIPPDQRTFIQKIAAATGGVVAPATPVTGGGHLYSFKAIYNAWQGNYVKAVRQAFWGRAPDTVDGLVAHYTETKSPFGAGFDAGGDNIVMTGLFGVLAIQGKIPPEVAGTLLWQRAQTVYENTRIRALGGDTNPTRNGKKAMFRASLYAGGILKREASLQEGRWVRAKLYNTAAAIMGELAMNTGAEALAEYRERRIALVNAAHEALVTA